MSRTPPLSEVGVHTPLPKSFVRNVPVEVPVPSSGPAAPLSTPYHCVSTAPDEKPIAYSRKVVASIWNELANSGSVTTPGVPGTSARAFVGAMTLVGTGEPGVVRSRASPNATPVWGVPSAVESTSSRLLSLYRPGPHEVSVSMNSNPTAPHLLASSVALADSTVLGCPEAVLRLLNTGRGRYPVCVTVCVWLGDCVSVPELLAVCDWLCVWEAVCD